jgi:hypothetical protein
MSARPIQWKRAGSAILVQCPTCTEWREGANAEERGVVGGGGSTVEILAFPVGWENGQCATCNGLATCPNCAMQRRLPFAPITLPMSGITWDACADCQAMPAKEQRILERRAAEAARKQREEAGHGPE